MFKVSIIKKYKILFHDFRVGEDWCFMMEYLTKTKTIYWLNLHLYFYRRYSSSTSSLYHKRNIELFDALEKRKEILTQGGLWNHTETIQNFMGYESVFAHYQKYIKIMPKEQRKLWHKKIRELSLSYSKTYRIWL